jgi:hypothetical protein
VSAKFVRGPLSVKVSVPFVSLRGPGTLIDTPTGGSSDGGGGSGSGSGSSGSAGSGNLINPGGTNRLVSGLGDMSVSLTYSLDLGNEAWFDATAKVKIPTASVRKGLGTGRTDVTLQGEVGKDFGPLGIYVGGRRKFAGSTAVNPLRDTWGAGGGARYRVSNSASVGIDYDWQQASFTGGTPSSEITAWTSFKLNKRLSPYVYGLVGTNSGSSEGASGVSITYCFD